MERHQLDVKWKEAMAAVQPALYAEAHRDSKKKTTPFTIKDFTLTGMVAAARRAERDAEKLAKPEAVWEKINGLMKGLGG